MADLEFFLDPVCPWAWITSRWVVEVQGQRDYDVRWRFISLKILNSANQAEWYNDQYRRWHAMGHEALRVAARLDAELGNDAVLKLYTAIGTEGHVNGRRDDFAASTEAFVGECLDKAGLPRDMISAAFDESWDARISADTEEALGRTGRDVGTPIITFRPGASDESSFFGPVIAKIPRGAEALRLWDAVETIATTSGLAELKRTLRASPDFS
jgi:protein-disulfide isomerase-like protein with CxxC motif